MYVKAKTSFSQDRGDFQERAFSQPIGVYSQPFKTKFGYDD